MTTIVDALTDATTALNNATQEILSLQQSLAQQAGAAQVNATTVINNFLARPAVQSIWCDPLNGNDADNGSTAALALKTLDTIIANMGTSATQVLLMNPATLSSRAYVYAPLSILGVTPTANGYTLVNQTISFLGTSTNSPIALLGSFCSGIWLSGPNFQAQNITFSLPDQPAGQNYPSHIQADSGADIRLTNCSLLVSSAAAGSLVGSYGNTVNVEASLALGSNAAGHVFQSVAAGSNPNSLYQYKSNITSG